MTLIEKIIDVMSDHRGAAHVNDIAKMLVERYPNFPISAEVLPDKVSAVLSADSRKTAGKARFSRVKNKSGGFRRGIYRLKFKPIVTPSPTPMPAVTTQYTGKAGESAVISELLFYGFNASAMAVDDGIDIVAGKDNRYFHIQVKTANIVNSSGGSFSIKKNIFTAKDTFQTFYILVMRERSNNRNYNDYIIFPSSQIRHFMEVGIIKDGPSLSLRIQKNSRGQYILNNRQDVTSSVNTFSQLS